MPIPRFRTTARGLARALACMAALGVAAACDGDSSGSDTRDAASVVIVSGDNQEARVGTELPAPLVVRVLDAGGRPVAGQVVNFRVSGGSGSIFGGAVQTDRNGEARDRWTLGNIVADSQRVEVRTTTTAGTTPSVLATFRARATPDAAARVEVAGGNTQEGSSGSALADSVSARVLDRFGNLVPGTQVSWTVRSGGGQLAPTTSTTGANGIARTSWVLGSRVDSVQVVEAAVAGVAARAQFTATAGVTAGVTFTITGGNGQTGAINTTLAQPLRVLVRRANGTPLVGIPVEWATTTGGTVTPAVSVTNAQGEATTEWRLGTVAGTHTVVATLRDAARTLSAQLTFTATARSGNPAAVNKTGPDQRVVVGEASSPFGVIVQDISGNGVAGVTVTWNSSGGASTFQPATSVTNAQGVATTTWTAPTTAGNYTITGSAAGFTSPTYTAAVVAGPVATLVADPTSVTMNPRESKSVIISAYDQYGNRVRTSFAITAVSSNTAVVEAFPPAAPSSEVILGLLSRAVGDATVTVRSSTASLVIPVRVASVPASVNKTGGDQTVAAGQPAAFPYGVVVRDIRGNGVPGITVTWNSSGNAGTFQPATSVTNADGVATSVWTAPTTPGNYTITGSAAGMTSPTYTVVVTPGPITTLVANPTSVTVRVGQGAEVKVSGRDQYGNVIGLGFNFSVVSSNPAVAEASIFSAVGPPSVRVIGRAAGDATVTVRSTTNTSASVQIPVHVDP